MNQHSYNTSKTNYFQDFTTYNSHKIDKSKTCNIKNDRYTGGHYYNKQQNATKKITNHIDKINHILTNESVLDFNIDNIIKIYYNGIHKSQIRFILDIICA